MFSKVLPTIGFILLAVIVSSMLLSYYNINMNDTSGLRVLNRQATYEGFKEGNKDKAKAVLASLPIADLLKSLTKNKLIFLQN